MSKSEYCKFQHYWNTFAPKAGYIQARKMYDQYLEVSKASTDIKKESLKVEDFIKAKRMLEMNCTTTATAYSNWISFAPIPQVECTVPCKVMDYPSGPNKKEKTMYVDNDKHIESSKINYLSNRIESIYYKKDGEFRKLFGLVNDEPPETALEMVKRIQDGKFVVKDENKEKRTYGDAARYITWRDPSVKEDKAGYDSAMKAFKVVHQDAQDTIAIGTPAEGLAAVKALDAWTPTVTASSVTAK